MDLRPAFEFALYLIKIENSVGGKLENKCSDFTFRYCLISFYALR